MAVGVIPSISGLEGGVALPSMAGLKGESFLPAMPALNLDLLI